MTKEMTAKVDRVFFTADFGCTTNAGKDCTTQLQAAIDATAAVGGTLVVQQGRMTLKGQIYVPEGRLNIRGAGFVNLLSWEGATFDGPAIRMGWSPTSTAAQRGKMPGDPPAIYFNRVDDIQFSGPQAPTTTVDGWRFGDVGTTDAGRWTMSRCQWNGFRHQQILGDGSFIMNHRDCVYTRAQRSALYFTGTLNSGENLSWTDCIFSNTATAGSVLIRAERSMLIDAYFNNCSFDYSNRVLIAEGGLWQFNSCHFESNSALPWFSLASNRPQLNGKDVMTMMRHTILMFNGGQIIPHVDVEGTRSDIVTIVKIDDEFTDGASTPVQSNRPSTVIFHGAHMAGTLQTRVLDTTRVVDIKARPRVSAVANATYSRWMYNDRWNFSSTSWGPYFNVLRNSNFDDSGTLFDNAMPGIDQLSRGWCLAAAARTKWNAVADTSVKLFGSRSMKFSSPGVITHEVMLQQFTAVQGAKAIDLCITDRLSTDYSGTYLVSITEFDLGGREVVPQTTLYTAKVFSSDPREAWRIMGYTHTPDVATAFIRLRIYGHIQGTIWFDSVEATQPT